uniref:FRIGIDA-like protein n=1 Tax=Quercus lobata TaxID=97700 RepID=A0A7N2MU44_QUELO
MCLNHGLKIIQFMLNVRKGFIQNLIEVKQLLRAIRFIYAFKLADKFPPIPFLRPYLKHLRKSANTIYRKQDRPPKEQNAALNRIIADMEDVLRCIKDHELESEISFQNLEEFVAFLRKQEAMSKATEPALGSEAQPPQQSVKKHIASANPAAPIPAPMPISIMTNNRTFPATVGQNIAPMPLTPMQQNSGGCCPVNKTASTGLLWAGICRKSIEEVQEKKMLLEKLQVRMNEAKAKTNKLKVSFENLLEKKPKPICYDGFEPSGRMHIAQLNNKMGGDLKKIDVVGRYLIEIWKAIGMDIDGGKVEFLWSLKEINSIKLMSTGLLCGQIMGRSDEEELTAAQIFYPCMQCADVFFLKADICQLGMDQRKVNVLAREYCDHIKRKKKPIILSHYMLTGLQQGQEKMSKSDPLSSIFIEDDEAKVNLKIKRAYCPPDIVEGNPCLEYVKYLILPWFKKFVIERSAENGGDKSFESFEELVAYYESGKLHPADLKPALAKALNKILEPVREHFKNDNNAKDLLKRVKAYRVTR